MREKVKQIEVQEFGLLIEFQSGGYKYLPSEHAKSN